VLSIFVTALLASLWVPRGEQCVAHPISVTRTLAQVSPEEVTVSIEGFLEDLYLFHDLKPNEQDILEPDEIKRGLELHKDFIARKFQIRDSAGEPLKLLGVRLAALSPLGDGVPLGDLMGYETIYDLRYELPSPPEFLTFTQEFSEETDLLPAEMVLQVKQENAGTPFTAMLMPDRPLTVRFNWENPALSLEASDEEWEEWTEEQKQETLGITSYASVYSFLYIEDHEVRHEILIPLATLEKSVSLERNVDEFLDLSEQESARDEIEAHFLEGNPIEVDGVEVSGTVERLDFFGVDVKDFARQAPRKRVPMGSARVGIILSYPSAAPPQTVKLTWNRFSEFLRRVNLAVIAYDDTSTTTLDRVEENGVFEWESPGHTLPASPAEVEASLPPKPMLSLPWFSLCCLLLAALALSTRKRCNGSVKRRHVIPAGLAVAAVLGWPVVRGEVPDPFRRPAEISAEEVDGIFEKLLRNVYGSFRFREESALYDALASSIYGDLLSEVYLQIRQGLMMQEQGGAMARVGEVDIENGERAPLSEVSPDRKRHPDSFGYRCQWTVAGTVEHWGHIHERTNQYSAVFAVEPLDGAWKITRVRILEEKRLQFETRLRRLTDSGE